MPGPKTSDASTMPLDSQAPSALRPAGSTSVGPSSADWSTFATTSGDPPLSGTRQMRAVVAFGSTVGRANC